MSAHGYFRTFLLGKWMSGLPRKADLKSAMSVFGLLTTALAQIADILAQDADFRF